MAKVGVALVNPAELIDRGRSNQKPILVEHILLFFSGIVRLRQHDVFSGLTPLLGDDGRIERGKGVFLAVPADDPKLSREGHAGPLWLAHQFRESSVGNK